MHTTLIHTAAGSPEHGLPTVQTPIVCATCGSRAPRGVPIGAIETPTTSGHAELFRFGGGHVCDACAWLFQAGKGRPGNFITYGTMVEYTVISLESVVTDKRPWLHVLRDLAALPPDTPVTGVMTTDVKPRLWHRARLATVGAMGLYVHAPEYDVSEWVRFDLAACLDAIEHIIDALKAGYSKASCYHGLLRDYARASRDIECAMTLDARLGAHRGQPHFLPALIAAGVTKEERSHVKGTQPDTRLEPGAAARDRDDQAQLGLFQLG
jgi:hypothetical protein